MGPDEVKAFLSHLATQMNVAASAQNQAFSALLFLYQEVIKERLPWIDDIVRAKRPAKLPVVFTQAEARAVLSNMHGIPRLMAICSTGAVWASWNAFDYGSKMSTLATCRSRSATPKGAVTV